MPRLLLTRPEADSLSLAAQLNSSGVETLIEPLLTVTFEDGPPLGFDDIDALLLTSANGARAAIRRMSVARFDKPVLCVGAATTRTARDLGFKNVTSADGDVDTLAALALAELPPGCLCLHVAASHVAGDLAGELTAGGLGYRREVLYSTETPLRFRLSTIDAIKSGAIDGVVLYSPRTAATFARLAERDLLTSYLGEQTAYCLSRNVAARLDHLPWAGITIAGQPNEAALVGAILSELP